MYRSAVVHIQVATIIAGVLLCIPLFVHAQAANDNDYEDQLHSEIRADLMKDPRISQFSEAEINAMVSALAEEAQKDGSARTYLDYKNEPQYTFGAGEGPDAAASSNHVLLYSVTALLVLLLLALWLAARRSARLKNDSTLPPATA